MEISLLIFYEKRQSLNLIVHNQIPVHHPEDLKSFPTVYDMPIHTNT